MGFVNINNLNMDKPKKLILDYSKWRCGEGGSYSLGIGKTELLNSDEFMCCLGMWSLQLGASKDELLHKGEPNEIKTLIPIFAEDEIYEYEELNQQTGEYEKLKFKEGRNTTMLASNCININDEKDTTPQEKIEALRERLAREGIELEVINKP